MCSETRYSDKMCKAQIFPTLLIFFSLGTQFPNVYSVVSKVMCWQKQESVDKITKLEILLHIISLFDSMFPTGCFTLGPPLLGPRGG